MSNLEKCIWKLIAENTIYSSFRDVGPESIGQRNYDCKFVCDGYKKQCRGYLRNNDVLFKEFEK